VLLTLVLLPLGGGGEQRDTTRDIHLIDWPSEEEWRLLAALIDGWSANGDGIVAAKTPRTPSCLLFERF
jgi:hypothetical protein